MKNPETKMKPTTKPKPQKPGFVFVGRLNDFNDAPMKSVRIMGKPVAVFRRSDGTFFSREMACKHQGADLTQSKVTGNRVTCVRHGWQYDLTTGQCINRDSPPLREHEVTVEEDALFVALFPSG